MEFHETVIGRRFFDHQLPGLIHELSRLNDNLSLGEKTDNIANLVQSIAISLMDIASNTRPQTMTDYSGTGGWSSGSGTIGIKS